MTKTKKQITVGCQVAFNKLPDAVWFDVLKIDGMLLVIREHGTNYATQTMEKSLVVQIQ